MSPSIDLAISEWQRAHDIQLDGWQRDYVNAMLSGSRVLLSSARYGKSVAVRCLADILKDRDAKGLTP